MTNTTQVHTLPHISLQPDLQGTTVHCPGSVWAYHAFLPVRSLPVCSGKQTPPHFSAAGLYVIWRIGLPPYHAAAKVDLRLRHSSLSQTYSATAVCINYLVLFLGIHRIHRRQVLHPLCSSLQYAADILVGKSHWKSHSQNSFLVLHHIRL